MKHQPTPICLAISILLLVITHPAAFGATSYYVDATNGSDTNDGTTLATPFQTLAAASAIMGPGDTCHIRAGVYRETLRPAASGTAGSPITYTAYNGEEVTISGADVIAGWTLESGSIYSATMAWDLGDGDNQVFVDGQMMHRARWPNTGPDLLQPTLAAGSAGTNTATFSVSRPANYWVGGTVHGWFSHRWTAQGATITASTAEGVLTVNEQTDPWWSGGGSGYITGVYGELDIEKEWFVIGGKLHLWAPGGVNPTPLRVEAKRRKRCVDLSGRDHIRIQNLKLFAGTILMNGTNRCEISGCTAKYLSHFTKHTWNGYSAEGNAPSGDNGVYINGDQNLISNCTFTHSAGSGIIIRGGGNTITRSLVSDTDYSGTYSCTVSIAASTGGNKLFFNTFTNTGRDVLQLYGANADIIMYNDMSFAGRLCRDLGITYQWGRDGQGTRLAYNWIHDNLATLGPGIYNDNYCRRFINDHNVIWNCEAGVRLNGPHDAMEVYNNTLFNCQNVGSNTYNQFPQYLPAYWTYGNVLNSTRTNNLFLGTNPASQLVDFANKDFRLKAGAAAIDAGTVVEPYTAGFVGSAPDLGAYESGAFPWTAGRDGVISQNPTLFNLSPANGAMLEGGGGSLVATFSHPIAIGTGDITIKNLTDNTQTTIAITSGSPQVTVSGSILTINPPENLVVGKNYAVQIAGTAIKDLADNPFAGISDDSTWSFTTVAPIAPTIATLNPADNATGVAIGPNLVATFSEAIAIGTGDITIRNLTDNTQTTIAITSGSPQITVSGSTLTINPTADLLGGKNYAIQIPSTAIKDLSDNLFGGISDDTTWNFSTTNATTYLISTDDIGSSADSDFHIQNNSPNTLVNTATLVAGSNSSAGTAIVRSYLGFDMTGLLANGQVTNATLRIHVSATATYGTSTLYARTAPFVPGGASDYDELTGTSIGSIVNGSNGGGTTGWKEIDVTSVVEGWRLSNLATNHGFAINGSEGPYTLAQQNFTSSTGANAPQLVVTQEPLPSNTFLNWINTPSFGLAEADKGFNDDPDGDGINNGLENYFGTHPGAFSQGLVLGTLSGNHLTFTHPIHDTPASDLTATYRWSTDLQTFHDDGDSNASATTTVTFAQGAPSAGMVTVTATITGTVIPSKLFVNVNVTQP